jgi:hypothetical protein
MSWITATTSGHTKKLTMHAMWFVGYSVGQMVAPQWWKNKYKPRNRVPWGILLVRPKLKFIKTDLLPFITFRLDSVARSSSFSASVGTSIGATSFGTQLLLLPQPRKRKKYMESMDG